MSLLKWLNERVKKFTWIDIKLCGLYGMFLGVIAVKLFPKILDFSIWWSVGGAVLIAIYLGYVTLLKK